ncbi:MAG: hypothetical protein ACLUCU_02975 [Slackia sp.]
MAVVSRFLSNTRKAAKEKPGVFALYVVLCLIVGGIFVRSIFEGRYEYALLCLLVFILFWIPSMLERRLSIDIPSVLESIILCFVFAAEILGEIDAFYVKIPFWDTMLHTTWGFLAAGIGFALADILNRSQASKLQLTPIYMAITAFCFSMTAGAMWELFEYAVDSFVGFDMQKDTIVAAFNSVTLDPTNSNVAIPVPDIVSTQITLASGEVVDIPNGYLDIGLHDSMADLFVNFLGAVTFSIIGFIYVKNRNRGRKKGFASHFIPKLRNSTK